MEIIDKIVSSKYPPNDKNAIWENNGKLFKIINGKWKEISSNGGCSTDRPSTETSLGYKVLRKEISFAEQVTEANTIYEIRDSFDLGGAETEIPENCTLKFNGGDVKNGVMIGNGTKLHDYKSLSCLLYGLFTDEQGNTISNFLKKKLRNQNLTLSYPMVGWNLTDQVYNSMVDRMNFLREFGIDKYQLVINVDCDLNGENLTFSAKNSTDKTSDINVIISAAKRVVSSVKNGRIESIKVHTENNNVDEVLRVITEATAPKVNTFLNLYKIAITKFVKEINDYAVAENRGKIDCVVAFNEEDTLLKTTIPSVVISLHDYFVGLKNIGVKVAINNVRRHELNSTLNADIDHTYFNAYLSTSYKGLSTTLEDVVGNPEAIVNATTKFYKVMDNGIGITETGCANHTASLIGGGYWDWTGTDRFPDAFYPRFLYFSLFFVAMGIVGIENFERIQPWYFDYSNNSADVANSNYIGKLKELFSNNLFE